MQTNEAPLTKKRIPGEPGLWIIIAGDLFVFSIFFLTFAYYRYIGGEGFYTARDEMTQTIGLINTLVLLSSSMFVAIGIAHLKNNQRRKAAPVFAVSAVLGGVFLANKAFEWYHLIHNGISIYTSDFFMLFFMFTGIHAFHVLLGFCMLIYIYTNLKSENAPPMSFEIAEGIGVFWHLIDVLWVVLFALLYLVR